MTNMKHVTKTSSEELESLVLCTVKRRLWPSSHSYVKPTEKSDFHHVSIIWALFTSSRRFFCRGFIAPTRELAPRAVGVDQPVKSCSHNRLWIEIQFCEIFSKLRLGLTLEWWVLPFRDEVWFARWTSDNFPLRGEFLID